MTNSSARRKGPGRPTREAIYQRFTAAIAELANYGGLPKPHEAKGLWDDVWHRETHHSTALEGNTLILREVEQLLQEGRAVGSKALKDYLEVLGYGEAAQWVYQQALEPEEWRHNGLVTLSEIRQVHVLALGKAWEVAPHSDAYPSEAPGSFRQHEIEPFPEVMTLPSHPLVAAELDGWVEHANQLKTDMQSGAIAVEEVPERLASLHREFEWIHPYLDGNGRTGRLLLNLTLTRLGWPPAIILKEQRARYLRALGRADHGDYRPLAELIARSVIDNLHRLIPTIAGPAKYVPLEALVDDEFSLTALRQATSRGRLESIIGLDGRYRSSRAALEDYKVSKYSRGKRKNA